MTTSTTPDDDAPPALFEHCRRVYAAMLDEARALAPNDNPDENEDVIIVYEGFLTKLITHQLNLSVPYYTSVRTALIRMGCVRQMRRGGGSSPSQWEMIYEPTLEAFLKAEPPKSPKQTKAGATEQQIVALARRVSDLEAWQEGVNDMLTEHFGAEVKETA